MFLLMFMRLSLVRLRIFPEKFGRWKSMEACPVVNRRLYYWGTISSFSLAANSLITTPLVYTRHQLLFAGLYHSQKFGQEYPYSKSLLEKNN